MDTLSLTMIIIQLKVDNYQKRRVRLQSKTNYLSSNKILKYSHISDEIPWLLFNNLLNILY